MKLTCSRDYSQAVDVGTLGRGIKLGTIRVLVWVMGFMANGYATEEFEVPLSLIYSPLSPSTPLSPLHCHTYLPVIPPTAAIWTMAPRRRGPWTGSNDAQNWFNKSEACQWSTSSKTPWGSQISLILYYSRVSGAEIDVRLRMRDSVFIDLRNILVLLSHCLFVWIVWGGRLI